MSRISNEWDENSVAVEALIIFAKLRRAKCYPDCHKVGKPEIVAERQHLDGMSYEVVIPYEVAPNTYGPDRLARYRFGPRCDYCLGTGFSSSGSTDGVTCRACQGWGVKPPV